VVWVGVVDFEPTVGKCGRLVDVEGLVGRVLESLSLASISLANPIAWVMV
jgi:hypothetical protein